MPAARRFYGNSSSSKSSSSRRDWASCHTHAGWRLARPSLLPSPRCSFYAARYGSREYSSQPPRSRDDGSSSDAQADAWPRTNATHDATFDPTTTPATATDFPTADAAASASTADGEREPAAPAPDPNATDSRLGAHDDASGPLDPTGSASSALHAASLPSHAERRRSPLARRLSALLDRLQTNAFAASQRLNDLTGYSGIEALKRSIDAQEAHVARTRAAVHTARAHYSDAIARRSASQREVNALLQRKHAWAPPDLERFTALYRSDHANEQHEARAAQRLAQAERAAEDAAARLAQSIGARYHEEQIWSDKIRRMSTWGTWGLMGVNVLLFVVFQVAVEPWRRRRLVSGFEEKVREAIERERLGSGSGGGGGGDGAARGDGGRDGAGGGGSADAGRAVEAEFAPAAGQAAEAEGGREIGGGNDPSATWLGDPTSVGGGSPSVSDSSIALALGSEAGRPTVSSLSSSSSSSSSSSQFPPSPVPSAPSTGATAEPGVAEAAEEAAPAAEEEAEASPLSLPAAAMSARQSPLQQMLLPSQRWLDSASLFLRQRAPAAVQDLFSERTVALRKLDVTAIALESAAAGAALCALVCFTLSRYT